MLCFIVLIIVYVQSLNRDLKYRYKKRDTWLNTHFPTSEYEIKTSASTASFVAFLFENPDVEIWQYLDAQDDAHEVVGGVQMLCNTDCCAKEDSEPGLLFLVTKQSGADGKKKVIIAFDPYSVKVLLRWMQQQQNAHKWILNQREYEGYEVKNAHIKDTNSMLSKPSVQLWEYIPAWDLAVRPHMDGRNFQYRKTFGHFFIVIEKSKEIFQPIILEKDAEAS